MVSRSVSIRFTAVGLFLLAMGSVAFYGAEAAPASLSAPSIAVRFFPNSGSTLKGLSAGGLGHGVLVYYQRSLGVTKPSLVVELSRTSYARPPVARVFQSPPDKNSVPVKFESGKAVPARGAVPSLVIKALGGYWKRSGITDYDLSISVFGKVAALWDGPPPTALPSHRLSVHIRTHMSPGGDPAWDFRRLVPTFSRKGFVRVNYAQRECNESLKWLPSPTPLWPYVAISPTNALGGIAYKYQPKQNGGALLPPGFEQYPGELNPPILVDWASAKVTAFSEVVSVRSQSCSYDFYSLNPVLPNRTNRTDFESPWGLYDLSGSHNGYPNLIINTAHYPILDPWSTGIDPGMAGQPPSPLPLDNVRYSWADHPGDRLFDYKVDLLGNAGFSRKVSIAGGAARVLAPPYADYPYWVMSQLWPAATFVDTNGHSYETSEGLYDWGSSLFGAGYWRGWSSTPHLSFTHSISDISDGFRGEFRFGQAARPLLYGSPVDGRWHLLGARAGIWNLGNCLSERELNLDGGSYINDWKLVQQFRLPKALCAASNASRTRYWAELAVIDGYLIFSNQNEAVIEPDREPLSVAFRRPPTNHTTWKSFVAATLTLHPKNPRALQSWLPPHPTAGVTVARGRISGIHAVPNGFRMLLRVPKRSAAVGSVKGLPLPSQPGTWLIRFDRVTGGWQEQRTSSPVLRAALVVRKPAGDTVAGVARIVVQNKGSDWLGSVSLEAGSRTLMHRTLWINGQAYWRGSVRLTAHSAAQTISVLANGRALASRRIAAAPVRRPETSYLLSMSLPQAGLLPALVTFALVLTVLGLFTWSRIR